jgi:hypothetical protein
VGRFGFQKVVEVPEGDHLGFVALRRDGVELQYRTPASLSQTLEGVTTGGTQDSTVLMIEMQSLDEVMGRLEGLDVLVPRRRTFYGNNEVVVRAPGGQIVIFTAPGNEPTLLVANPFAQGG